MLMLAAVVAVLAVSALLGAYVLAISGLEGPAGVVLAAAAVLGIGVLPPTVLALRTRSKLAKARLVAASLLAWNVVVLGGLLALGPRMALDTLRSHGAWMLPEAWGKRLGVTSAPEPVAASPILVAADAAVAEGDAGASSFGAEELFAAVADTVLVVSAQGPRAEGAGEERPSWGGSGVLIAGDGTFVTNHHVLGNAERATVKLRDGRELPEVTILARDAANDLVLARALGQDLRAATLADQEPGVGTRVYAIGSPLGLEFSLTEGIVSAVRDMSGTRMIQMQADIAPGSSGGPLFDPRGRVVGINTAVRGAGLNFAVDARHVRALLAAPREAPVTLAAYEPQMSLESFVVEGQILPTDREALEDFANLLASGVAGCAKAPPPEARVHYRRTPPFVESNLGDDADQCLRGDDAEVSVMLASLVRLLELEDPRTKLNASFERLGGRRGHRLTLVVDLTPP